MSVPVPDGPVSAALRELTAALAHGLPAGPGVAVAREHGLGGALADLPPGTLVLPTSGSTSSPRLVVRTAASWTDSFAAFTQVTGLGARGPETVWVPGPASATMTLFAAWHATAAGWGLRAEGTWRGVPDADLHGVTCLHAVPAVAADVLEARARGRLPRLRTVVVAGAPSGPHLRPLAAELGVRVVEYYGAAELSFVAVDADGAGLVPFPAVEIRADDGEVEVRSPWVCSGYLADRPGPMRRRDGGWVGVGDRGSWDGAHLRVSGRGGGATVGGVTVHLADVEATLRDVPGVAEAACVAVASAGHGEVVAALVEPGTGVDPGGLRRALLRAASAQLVPAARPRHVVVGRLPRGPAGKVDRAALASWVATSREAGS